MGRGWAALCLPVLLAAGPVVPDPAQRLAGRYSTHFRNGDVDGRSYWSDDVVEIDPADARNAYFRIALNFFNGHRCDLAGVAQPEGATLDYRAAPDGGMAGCHMTLSHRGPWLRLDDHGGTCRSSCGARGGYAAAGMPWRSRRPITYVHRLRSSPRYAGAMTEWRSTEHDR